MHKKWNIPIPNPQLQVLLSNTLGVHPIVAQLLINRDLTTLEEARHFLRTDFAAFHDPFLLKDMDRAVERISQAVKRRETVLIFGDYDVDGVTSSVVLHKVLKQLGLKVLNYIPHRMNEGYGLNHAITEYAVQRKVDLLISVDCGITAVDEVAALNQAGIDVIIIDHHEPLRRQMPLAVAVIDPKREDCPYPYKGLAAVGLVFKLAQALIGDAAENFLDLVALGTIADVAELNGENRIFAKVGLEAVKETKNLGLRALIKTARLNLKKVKTYSIGFVLGPRINASGRLDSAERALRLLLSEDEKEAFVLAQELEEINRQRQKTQNRIVEEALNMVERDIHFKDHKIIVLSKEGWHQGVVGIVASRLVEKFYRPTVVISLKDGVGTGSARSIDGFHIFEALRHCADLLENFGGHKHAAGLTIAEQKIAILRNMLNEFAEKVLPTENLIPTLDLDCEIPLSEISLDLVRKIEDLEPYGEGNPLPLFCSRRLTVKGPPMIHSKDTLKFWVTDGKLTVSAVGFGMGRYYDLVLRSPQIDLAYALSIDDWNKSPTVQLKIKDIKSSQQLEEK